MNGVDIKTYVNCDADIQTSPSSQDVDGPGNQDLQPEAATLQEEDDEQENDPDEEFIDNKTAILYVNKLIKYAFKNGNPNLVNYFMQASSELCNIKLNSSKQTKIFDYFKP